MHKQRVGGGGNGGPGQAFPIFPAPVISPAIPSPIRPAWTTAVGPTGTYAGGGGGGATSGSFANPLYYKGQAGGGNGAISDPGAGGSAVLYTGSGGGAGSNASPTDGNGGIGIILIRYLS